MNRRQASPGEGFSREDRLLRREDFDRTMAEGRKARTRNLVVFVAPRDGPGPRLGLAVSRKVGCAVCRNRWKRLIREVFRKQLKARLPPVDLVVLVRAAPDGEVKRLPAGLAGVERDLLWALGRTGMLGCSPP